MLCLQAPREALQRAADGAEGELQKKPRLDNGAAAPVDGGGPAPLDGGETPGQEEEGCRVSSRSAGRQRWRARGRWPQGKCWKPRLPSWRRGKQWKLRLLRWCQGM